eukprot:1441050-Rhodomonas_salina.1
MLLYQGLAAQVAPPPILLLLLLLKCTLGRPVPDHACPSHPPRFTTVLRWYIAGRHGPIPDRAYILRRPGLDLGRTLRRPVTTDLDRSFLFQPGRVIA